MVLASRKITVAVILALVASLPSYSAGQQSSLSEDWPSGLSSMIRSALVPGLGEMSIGRTNRGKLFAEIELGLWLVVAENYRVADGYRWRLESYAALHADASLGGKNDKFLMNVGDFPSTEAYNEAQQRERTPNEVYPRGEKYHWQWDDDSHRKRFRQFRARREQARKLGRFFIGGMVLNRLISVIDVSYLYRVRGLKSEVSFSPVRDTDAHGIEIVFAHHF